MSPVARDDAETIQRTLILAQRAADSAIAEAEAKARELLDESEAKAQALVSDAEANARRIHDEEMRQHDGEIAALLARRDRLQADADALERYATDYRSRVVAAVETDLAKFGVTIDPPSPRPELHDLDVTTDVTTSNYVATSR